MEGDSSKGSSSLDEDGDDVISRLTRGVGGCGLGESLAYELNGSDYESDGSESGESVSEISDTHTEDTQTDANLSGLSSDGKKKHTPLNKALRDKITRELMGPSKFDDPAVKNALERRALRHSIAASSARPNMKVLTAEVGNSLESTVARNLSNQVFSKPSDSNSKEYLDMLRERRKSRAQLARVQNIKDTKKPDSGVSRISIGVVPSLEVTEHEQDTPSPQATPRTTNGLASPRQSLTSRSMPDFSITDIMEGEEEDGGDLISRLVGRNTHLVTPTVRNSRKVSLQEELMGGSPQPHRPMRTSVAGEIAKSAGNSPANKDPISPGNPYRGVPQLDGLIIPDKWKDGFQEKIIEESSDECSSDEN